MTREEKGKMKEKKERKNKEKKYGGTIGRKERKGGHGERMEGKKAGQEDLDRNYERTKIKKT
jgi:hypothetical protein